MKMLFQFEAKQDKNILFGKANDGFMITAYVTVPGGVGNDYGYLTMKTAIIEELDMREISRKEIRFPYDGQEQHLTSDADADTDVYIDIIG